MTGFKGKEEIYGHAVNNLTIEQFFAVETGKKNLIGIDVTRRAKNDEDFELIYEREREKIPASNEDVFIALQEKLLLPKKNKHNDFLEKLSNPMINDELLTVIDNYISYIKQRNNNPSDNNHKHIDKLSVPACGLMYVYLSISGGKAVTQQNKDDLAKEYGYKNGTQLRNEFTHFSDENNRLNLNTENKKSAKGHLKRYEDILPLLEGDAYDKANEDYNKLKKIYIKYF